MLWLSLSSCVQKPLPHSREPLSLYLYLSLHLLPVHRVPTSVILEDGSSIYGGGDGRSTRKVVKEAFLHFMRQDHVVGKVARSLVSDVIGMRAPPDEMERSKTTVTATSDVSDRPTFLVIYEVYT